MSVGVPGAPAGYAQLAQLCSLPLSELVAPAISIAEQGFAWSALCTMLAAEADDLLVANQPDGCHFRPASGPLAHNALVRLPGLARVLGAFVERRETLFHGSLGEALVRRVAAAGGVLEMDDLLRASALWSEPASLCSPGAPTIWTTPGPTYGPALLSVLAEHHKERGAELARSVQRVLADQARLGRVPDFWRTDGTSVVTAADTDGGAVVIVHSNSFPQFGSGLVIDELDLVLSNRAGRGFSADPSSENFPSHTRRPLTTLHAWAIGTKRPQLLGGTAGGVQQVAWNAQVLTSLLDTELCTDMAPERRAPDLAPPDLASPDLASPDLASPDLASAVAAAIVAPLWCLEGEHIIAEPDESMESGDNVTFIEPLTMRSTQVVAMPGGHDAMASAWADPRHEAIALAI
jgi:gamma-glutamyltranspeptidase/glutathione hydrolase